MEYYVLLYLCLFSLGAASASGCQPVACGCKSETSGAAVNLTALDMHLVEINQPLTLGNSTAQYYLQLCTPLKLTGSCSDSTVCKVDGSVYTSYGNAVSYQVSTTSRAVLVIFNNGDPVDETPRQVSVTIYCSHGSDGTQLNTANDTFLDFTIYTNLQCMTVDIAAPSPALTTTPTTSVMSTSPNVSVSIPPASTMLLSSPSHGTMSPQPPSFTVTPTQSVPSSFSPGSTSLAPPTPASATPTATATPSQSSHSPMPGSTVPPMSGSPHPPMSGSPHPPMSGSPHPTSTSQPAPPKSTSNPVLPSSSPKPVCDCDSCTKTLALGLGVAIPSSAIVTLIVTILFCVCCLKTRKGSNYMRLTAPSVAFDEEDRD